jgi:DNA-binding response OmpR family regulator
MSQTHILIIDDEANLRQTMLRILKQAGYEVTAAANGLEGLNLLAQHEFDLVYLDIRMPDMNGLDVLTKIHETYPDLAVILFTAQPDIHSAIQALRHGASDYLLKPLKPSQVIERTHAILAKQENNRRKREIQEKIESLKAELDTLAGGGVIKGTASTVTTASDRYLTRGKLTLDLHRHQVTVDHRLVDLPITAFNYLLSLARHAPGIVDYQTLVAEAQGYEATSREAQELAKWHIHHIRQAIEANVQRPSIIINVRGIGYRLVGD